MDLQSVLSRSLLCMAFPTIPSGPASSRPVQEATTALAKALRGLKQLVVAGASANTDIGITGITTADVLVSVIEVPASAALVDRTAISSITSAGHIQATSSTSGNQLIVTYFHVA